tara:strand:- start:655 stop:825 length:171 start_codon:yes stop_codon:yes gene_type:complete
MGKKPAGKKHGGKKAPAKKHGGAKGKKGMPKHKMPSKGAFLGAVLGPVAGLLSSLF